MYAYKTCYIQYVMLILVIMVVVLLVAAIVIMVVSDRIVHKCMNKVSTIRIQT